MVGHTFDALTILSVAGNDKHGNMLVLARCECGNEKTYIARSLRNGNTHSCGCQRKARISVAFKTHGASDSLEYQVWAAMKNRCENPASASWPRYGGRGIVVCESWRVSFMAFSADMGPRPEPSMQIDRIDNDGNYEPGNCRWATPMQNVHNSSRVRNVTIDGETACLRVWARRYGIDHRTIGHRLDKGWSHDAAVKTPTRKRAA